MDKKPLIKKVLTVGIILLFVETCIIPAIAQDTEKASLSTSSGNWLYVGGSGPGNYTRIQDAVNASSSGDTVFVYNGIYYENVVVKKTINLKGENRDLTIISGLGTGKTVTVITDWVNISNFMIINSGHSDYRLDGGISISANKVTINYCTLKNNWAAGMIEGNYNCVQNCKICYNTNYLFTRGSYTTIKNNNIYSNSGGVYLEGPNGHNLVQNNTIHNNNMVYGIYVVNSPYNLIINNTISGNSNTGIYLDNTPSYGNLVYHNNIIGNIQNAWGESSNTWDNGYPSGGNYWSDYTGQDNNHDGIGDTPYNIPGGNEKDRYPFMKENGWLQPHVNQPPVANFTYNPFPPTDLNVIQFTDKSTDSDGTISSWVWSFGDGGTSILQNPTHKYADDGTYYVMLTVTDNNGANNSITKKIVVNNVPPTAGFTYSPSSPNDEDIIHFTDESTDADGTISSWVWDFGDGNISSIRNPTHQYLDDGTYSVTLNVTDDDGKSDSIVKNVMIRNVPPIADAGGPYIGTTDYAIQFNGSKSYDSDGTIVTYEWDFGDGTTGTGVNPTHKYSEYSLYEIDLVVKDDDGLTDTSETLVNITKGTLPIIKLLYPVGGEVLNGTVPVKWYALDTEDGVKLSINIYFKNVNDSLWTAFTNNPYVNTGELNWDTTSLPDGSYELQIVARDSNNNLGSDTSSMFQIKNYEEPPENLAPDQPGKPSGSAKGKSGVEYTYTTITTDPESDKVFYLWDWGDGNTSGWLGPFTSGVTCEAKHIWNAKNTYSIRVKAKDIYGKESSWSDPLPITMPYSYDPIWRFLELLFQRFPNAFPLLRQLMGY